MEEINKQENILKTSLFDIKDMSKEDFSVEERNYSKLSLKKLKRLRVDGVAFGYNIPVLKYDLKKPEKKRKSFIVFGIISSIILALGVFAFVRLCLGIVPPLLESAGLINDLGSNNMLSLFSLGLTNIFGKVMSIFFWLLAIAVISIVLALVAYLAYFVRVFFNLSRCSIQEMAVGYETRGLLFNSIILIVLSAICNGVLIYGFTVATEIAPVIIVIFIALLAVLIYAISILVCLIYQKRKAKEIFNQLSIEEQENFKSHNKAIERVKDRIKKLKGSDGQETWNFY